MVAAGSKGAGRARVSLVAYSCRDSRGFEGLAPSGANLPTAFPIKPVQGHQREQKLSYTRRGATLSDPLRVVPRRFGRAATSTGLPAIVVRPAGDTLRDLRTGLFRMRRALQGNNRRWLIGTLLVALLVRALIPAGFMPATDRPFSFQVCPDGFPTALLQSAQDPHAAHHHHHDGNGGGAQHNHSSAGSEHCVFAAAAGAGAVAFAPTFSAPAVNLDTPQFPYVAPALETRRFRVQQPRGPPALS